MLNSETVVAGDNIAYGTKLFSSNPWVDFEKGEKNICLDGTFTAQELKAIAKFMEENR